MGPQPAERQASVAAHREHESRRGALDGERAHEDRGQDHEEVELAEADARQDLLRQVVASVVAIGNPNAWPSAIAASMSGSRQDDREQEDRADDAREPDRGQDAARRLAARVDRLLAERAGGVEPVDHEQGA